MSNSNYSSELQSKEQRMLLSVALYSGVPLTEDEVDEHNHDDDVADEKEQPSWSVGGLIVVSATLLTAFLVLLVGAAVSGKGCSMLSRNNNNNKLQQQRPMDVPYQLRGSSSATSYEAEKNVPLDTMPFPKKKPCGKKAKQPEDATETKNTVAEIMIKANKKAMEHFVQDTKKVMEGKDLVETEPAEDAIASKEDVVLMPTTDMSITKATTMAKKPCDKKKKTPTEDLSEMDQVVSSPAEVEMIDELEQVTEPEPKLATKKMGCDGKKAAAAAAAAAASEETSSDVAVTNKMMTSATVETAVDPLWTRPLVVDSKDDESKDSESKDGDREDEDSKDKDDVDPLTDDGSLDSVGSDVVAYDDDSWLIDNVDKEPLDLDESFDEEEGKEDDEIAHSFEQLPMAEERLAVAEEDEDEEH